jgi:flagellar capping protein FliD
VQANGTGLLTNAQAGLQTQMTGIDSTIADAQTRVDNMTARLQQQMAAADSLIASMEQQYNYIYGLFQAQSTADQQYK